MPSYSAQSSAIRAARSVLGKEASVSRDFHLMQVETEEGMRWCWSKKPIKDEKRAAQGNEAPKATRKPPTSAKRQKAAQEAATGKLPPPPDFSAQTHAPYRKRLQALIDLVNAGDADGLEAVQINPTSTSPKAMARYRDLAVTAIRAAKKG